MQRASDDNCSTLIDITNLRAPSSSHTALGESDQPSHKACYPCSVIGHAYQEDRLPGLLSNKIECLTDNILHLSPISTMSHAEVYPQGVSLRGLDSRVILVRGALPHVHMPPPA